MALFIVGSPRKYEIALIFDRHSWPLPSGISTMSRGTLIIETRVWAAFTLTTMIESVSLPLPRASLDGFESLPRTRTVRRRDANGLGGGAGVGDGVAVGLGEAEGEAVGVGDAAAVAG